MLAILQFVFLIINFLLDVVVWIVIANAILSWLITFQVVNMRNRVVYGFVRGLDRVTAPLLWPLRRFIPPLGGMDFTPVILIVVIKAAQIALLPALYTWLAGLLGG
jgi:YggT family protein